MSEPIHHSLHVDATPDRVYAALTDSDEFAKLSGGAPTAVGGAAGEPFSCFGGMIEGRQIELVPNQRIVQAWRVKNWEPGVYSIVRFELTPEAGGTRLDFEHSGFPAENREHLDSGWHANYWGPLTKHLTGS